MSLKPTNLRADVARLVDDGYEIAIEHSHLVMRNVPYVTSSREIKRGMLISTLTGSFREVVRPSDHVIMFAGDYPCNADGKPLESIRNATCNENVAGQWVVNHRFSSKPKRGYYIDYYDKLTTYAAILANQAMAIDPDCTPRTYRIIASTDDSPFSVFRQCVWACWYQWGDAETYETLDCDSWSRTYRILCPRLCCKDTCR